MPSRLSVDDLVANMTEQDLNSIEYGGYECAICMESDGPTPPLKLGCSHSFCTGCLRQYALSQLRQKACTPPPCPLCKRLMRTQEVASAFASEPSSKAEFIQLLKRAQAGLPLDVQPATASRAPAARRVTRGRPFSLPKAACSSSSATKAQPAHGTRDLHTQAAPVRLLSLRGLASSALGAGPLQRLGLGRRDAPRETPRDSPRGISPMAAAAVWRTNQRQQPAPRPVARARSLPAAARPPGPRAEGGVAGRGSGAAPASPRRTNHLACAETRVVG